MEQEKPYAVVQFHDSEEVSVVPTNWLVDNTCSWPPGKDTRTLIIRRTAPKEYWQHYKFLLVGTYDTYDTARTAERAFAKSTTEDDETTTRPGKRKVVKKRPKDFVDPYDLPTLGKQTQEEICNFEEICSGVSFQSGASSSQPHTSSEIAPVAEEIDGGDMNDPTETPRDPSLSMDKKLDILLETTTRQQALLNIILTKVNTLVLDTPTHHRHNPAAPAVMLTTPLSTINNLLDFDEKLLAEEDTSMHLMKKFQMVGGSDYKSIIRRCMKITFSNQLGCEISWTGQKNNFKISDLKIMECMKRATQTSFPNTTDRMFEVVVAEWLRFSKQRIDRQRK